MENSKIYVIVFDSTHSAIAAEKCLKDKKIPNEIIPTPREITASCGLSIRFNIDSLKIIKEALQNGNISINGIYELKKQGNEKLVDKLI
ncbi:DUF3343 domain-containing protein [Alkaliphilus peptidifermentans]|uniref:Putative Se/S carrier protein-like domain-containing protein n=1 Tax=Alkaliphilus peptidifermentans DSM 18978 TaxID=1120976 RepID=A0A1G5AVR5_9FIRM|nr:DUF3343 domain-containing protein [Alkaliphilus peptidifermentans]SCX81966.1 Protein of unknown function [Alkaliphilus peptidifermentans DSM 18978]